MGVALYDRPPPDTRPDVGPFGVTFAAAALPALWDPPTVEADRVRFAQTAGGHTGVAVPRGIRHAPFWRMTAPIAWSTITLTINTGGNTTTGLVAASPFPRHYLYDHTGRLSATSGLIGFKGWLRSDEEHDTPWAGDAASVPVTGVAGEAERSIADAALVSRAWKQHRLPTGHLLSERPITSSEVDVLLDGILVIEVDRRPVSEVGPGAIFDPSKRAEESKRPVTVRARTPCRSAVMDREPALTTRRWRRSASSLTTRLEVTLDPAGHHGT
jgi:hypothetical protein